MENYINSMLAGSVMNMVSAAYLVCLFGTAIFKPSCIKKGVLFRMGYTIFAMSFIIPVLPTLLVATELGQYLATARSMAVIASSGGILMGLSMILTLGSLGLEQKGGSQA